MLGIIRMPIFLPGNVVIIIPLGSSVWHLLQRRSLPCMVPFQLLNYDFFLLVYNFKQTFTNISILIKFQIIINMPKERPSFPQTCSEERMPSV